MLITLLEDPMAPYPAPRVTETRLFDGGTVVVSSWTFGWTLSYETVTSWAPYGNEQDGSEDFGCDVAPWKRGKLDESHRLARAVPRRKVRRPDAPRAPSVRAPQPLMCFLQRNPARQAA